MGCATSKLDELPAVSLCRERCTFLDEAIHHRYALAEAHKSYTLSLKSIGFSLHTFFNQQLSSGSPLDEPPSPVLNLPSHRKPKHVTHPPGSDPKPTKVHSHSHSHSHSGSHLHFHSDSDEDDSGSESLHLHDDDDHHHVHDSSPPVHMYGHSSYSDHQTLGSGSYPPHENHGFMNTMNINMNYMKNQRAPSVLYQQRPISPDNVQIGESSSSSSYYPYHPYNSNSSSSPYNSNNLPYNNYSNYGGFFGSSSSAPVGDSLSMSAASSSKQPPPPPSPPRGSAWDFLNPFESFEKFYQPTAYTNNNTPSRSSKELREEEGIPDLEDEVDDDDIREVVKEVHGHEKFIHGGGGAHIGGGGGKGAVVVEDEDVGKGNYPPPQRVSMENDHHVEYDVHVVDEKAVNNEAKSGDRGNVSGLKAARGGGGFNGDFDVVREIQLQFQRASESANEFAKLLEVGKLPHNRKHATYQASKILHAPLSVVSSQASTSKSAEPPSVEKADLADLDNDTNLGLSSETLSSTLHKLYLWEKKLYEEVKAEEKMRVLHERKSQKLKRMDERGAEAHKVDGTRSLVRSLSTKIRIAIQVVDKISVKINKLRDEELWPQLNEFIQGSMRMWKTMLECHHSQCHAIGEARRLDAAASRKHFTDAHIDATSQLEHELLNWTSSFSCWVGAQKGYVKALNNWLLKCLLYVPEETADGIVPFSPGRIGAPPVFIICNQWSQALERISEKEVVDSMRDFVSNVLHLWERDKLEMRQRMMVNKDMESKVRNLEKEDQKIQKKIQALEKRLVLFSGDGNGLSLLTGQRAVYQSDTIKNTSLQVGLKHIFEAMERFTSNNLKAYEELLQRIKDDILAQKREQVS